MDPGSSMDLTTPSTNISRLKDRFVFAGPTLVLWEELRLRSVITLAKARFEIKNDQWDVRSRRRKAEQTGSAFTVHINRYISTSSSHSTNISGMFQEREVVNKNGLE